MKKQSLPETDYQTRCIEAERKARDFESAYFKAEERYSNLMDAYIKLQGYYLELLGAEKSKPRAQTEPTARPRNSKSKMIIGLFPMITEQIGRS